MAAASSRSLPNLASVELDEITWTNEVIKAQQWSCYSPSAACEWLQPSPTAMAQSGQLYHIDDNDYCCPYSSDHIPQTATVSCVTLYSMYVHRVDTKCAGSIFHTVWPR